MKSIPIVLFALAGAIFASCSREKSAAPRGQEDRNPAISQATPQKPLAAPITQENQNWAILSESDYSHGSYYDRLQEIWQPSESDVPHAIKEARPYLEKLKKTNSSANERKQIGAVLAAWDEYGCQAIGHTKDGKKLIYLSFFPKSEMSLSIRMGDDWRHNFIAMQDGGTGYWRITYDSEAKSFSRFVVNDDSGEDRDARTGDGYY